MLAKHFLDRSNDDVFENQIKFLYFAQLLVGKKHFMFYDVIYVIPAE